MTAPNQSFSSGSLYVGDLQPDVTESVLYDVFKQAGQIASIRVCRDAVTRRSLGYAYVNYHNVNDAERALDTLNYTSIKNHPCRLMWSYRDPSLRKSGSGNVFIKNLDKSIDSKGLHDAFSSFGNILSCKVVTDSSSSSKGYGFVHYDSDEAANQAIEKLNGMLMNGKKVYVGRFIPKKERIAMGQTGEQRFTNIYVKNLDKDITTEKIKALFSPFGDVQSAIVMTDEKQESRGFGFVNYKDHRSAEAAIVALNGKPIGEKQIYVCRAQKKGERLAELREKFDKLRQERANKYQGINLYVKNLDDSIDDDKLRQEFSAFGTITSCKVMRDDKVNSNSKGFGFVCFSTPEEATKAVTEMNGRMLLTKPIYVALHQRKEERQAQLEAQRAQRVNAIRMQTNGLSGAPIYPGMPVYYPQPNMGQRQQQSFSMVPSRPPARWGPPQPQRTPGYQPIPYNMAVPVQQRGAGGAAPAGAGGAGAGGGGAGGGGGGGAGGPRGGQPRGAPARGQQQRAGAGPAQRSNGKYPSQPRAAAAQQPAQTEPVINSAALANASAEERKQILGEALYPQVHQHQPDLAGKITGMFLESMEHPDLLHLLSSQDALALKIQEAVAVLQSSNIATEVEETA